VVRRSSRSTAPVKISTSIGQLNIIIADKRGDRFKITKQIRPNDREVASEVALNLGAA